MRRSWRESDRVVRATMPVNAGGAKDPDFWCAFDDGEVKVIGDEPDNTCEYPDPSEKALSQGEGGAGLPLLRALRQDLSGRHPASCLCSGSRECGRPGRGRGDLRGDRGGGLGGGVGGLVGGV